MKAGGLSNVPPMGGKGKVVEADETYFGNLPEAKLGPTKSKGQARAPGPAWAPTTSA